jgi:3-oxoacyl-[acyl-carrier protein] reductase
MSQPLVHPDLTGQVAIVTGGGRGIGRSIAIGLAAAGTSVAILARTAEQIKETADLIHQVGGRVETFVADVTDEQRVNDIAAQVESSLGPITLLINNAAGGRSSGPIWEGDADDWWRDIEVNLRGPYLCTRAVLPGMLARQQGRIINLGTNIAVRPAPYVSAYSCSKAALLRLTDSLAESVRGFGIQVFAISPGWVWTDMTRRAVEIMKEMNPDFAGIPESEVDPPEKVVKLVLRIASGEVDSLSGRYIHVRDDLDLLLTDIQRIQEEDLYTLRLKE